MQLLKYKKSKNRRNYILYKKGMNLMEISRVIAISNTYNKLPSRNNEVSKKDKENSSKQELSFDVILKKLLDEKKSGR